MRPVAFFIRHGETEGNDLDVFRGDQDWPLNDEGRAQAERLVKFFRHNKFSRIYSSDRKRVRQTLSPLAKDKGMRLIIVPNIESLNTGDFTGYKKTKENVKAIQWYARHPEIIIPGGESFKEFQDRVDPQITRFLKAGEDGQFPVVVGVHGSILKELHRMLYGTTIAKARVATGGVECVFKSAHGYEAVPVLGAKDGEDVKHGIDVENLEPGS
jgi:broad specificity phosphatase PhoE